MRADDPTPPAPAWRAAAIFFVALAVTLTVHWPVLGYGFVYDDYAFLQPLAWSDVGAAFSATWDPTGVMVPFFRPLTVLLHKLTFDAFQFDARLYHLLSLALVGLAGGFVGLWIAAVARATWAGMLGAAITVVHPAGVFSMTAWITNQMHAVQAVLLGLALWAWWHVRERGALAWVPLLVLQIVAFLVKEDGIVLLASILVLHAVRPGVPWRRRLPPAAILAAAPALCGLLLWWRTVALGGLGGYGAAITWERSLVTLSAGPRALLASPVGVGLVAWAVVAAAFVAAWRSRTPGTRDAAFLVASGLAIVLVWNLPFVYVTKPEQYYALTIGASIALTGAVLALVRTLPATVAWRAAVGLAVGAWMVAAATDSRLLARHFAPARGHALATDDIVREWNLPHEMDEFLVVKGEAVRQRQSLPSLHAFARTVSYGFHPEELDGGGHAFRWTRGAATVFVHRRFAEFRCELRALAGGPEDDRRLRVLVDGREAEALVLEDGRWTEIAVRIPSSRLRSFARVDIDAGSWRPSETIAGSNDGRELGVQVRGCETR